MKNIKKPFEKLILKPYSQYIKIIEGYGFVYNPYYHLITYIGFLIAIMIFVYYFELKGLCFTILLIILSINFPIFILLQYEYGFEEKLFREFTLFIAQLSASFKMHPKINQALMEAKVGCTSHLKEVVEKVLFNLGNGDEYLEAFKPLDEAYDFFVLHNIIVLMSCVEKYGATKYEEGINLILEDLDDCIEDMYLHHKELLAIKARVYLLCLMSIFIGFISKNMLNGIYNFHNSIIYQVSIMLYVLTILAAVMACLFAMRKTWIIWRVQK